MEELREKEDAIQRDINNGVDYTAGEITVLNLVQRYINLKRDSVRYNTTVGYNYVYNIVEKEDFGYRMIKTVKTSDAKQWLLDLHKNQDYSYSTLTQVKGVLKPAFQLAVDDEILRNNPFLFRVVDVVPNDSEKRIALTKEETERFLEFVMSDKCRKKHYDEIVILLHTGLRISELCGLTRADVDFKENRICVDRQLTRTRHCEYYIEKTKTDSGKRYVPLTPEAVNAFHNVINNRKKVPVETMVDGIAGFLFLDKDGKPKVAGHLEHAMKRMVDKYNQTHDEQIKVTPHVLRHTFCTNMMRAGVPLKDAQYIMGHSDAETTLNVYTHSNYDEAKKSFEKALKLG